MRLTTKFILLALVPLGLSLLLIAAATLYQGRSLVQRERELVETEYMQARRAELRHYVDLARSAVMPLYQQSGLDDAKARDEAIRRLSTLDYGSDGYFFVYDLQGVALMHSRQPELVGRNLWSLRDPEGRLTIQKLITQAREGGGYVDYLWQKPSTGQMVRKLGYVTALPRWNLMLGTGLYLDDVEHTLARLDEQVSGSIAWTLGWVAAMAGLGLLGISATGLWLNLSEHKVADQKLRLLAGQLVRSQEDERAHLARELHDGSSQTLVSAKLLIESALDDVQRGAAPSENGLARALCRVTDSLTEMRRISHRLRPAMLDTLGLPAALEQLAHEAGADGQLQFEVLLGQSGQPLPEGVKTALFRVAQEALANIAKHAGARHVQIILDTAGDGGVHLEISDDGRGFDLEAVNRDPRAGIGLRNIRERLAALGGGVVFHTRPGQGTRLEVHVPPQGLQGP